MKQSKQRERERERDGTNKQFGTIERLKKINRKSDAINSQHCRQVKKV
jgi:hypothetical protein